jgi:hypothetical protein
MLLTDGDTKLPDVLDLGVDTQAGARAARMHRRADVGHATEGRAR